MNPTLKQILITLGSILVVAGVGLLVTWFWRSRDAMQKLKLKSDEEKKELRARVTELEAKLRIIDTQVVGIDAVFQSVLVKALTHFHTPVTDALLAKLGDPVKGVPRTITDAEEKELIAAMRKIMADPLIPDSERDDAEILIIQIRRAKREALAIAAGAQFVGIKVVGLLQEGESE